MPSRSSQERLLLVIDNTAAGGACTVLLSICEQFQDSRDLTVAVLGKTGSVSSLLISKGVRVVELGQGNGRWSLLPFVRLVRLLRRERFDVLHCHLLKSSVAGGLVRCFFKIPFILHDHSDLFCAFERIDIFSHNPLVRMFFVHLLRWILRRADRVIVLSEESRQVYLHRYSWLARRVSVLPNALDCHAFDRVVESSAHELRQELKLPPRTRIVTMIGRLTKAKGWDTFLDTAKLVLASETDCAFFVVGTGPDEQRLKDRVRSEHIDPVHFLGFRSDVPALLAQSDVFLFTPPYEPFGIVLLEAMAARCPVVSVSSAGTRAVLGAECGLLIPAGDSGLLARGIFDLLHNPKMADEQRLRGRKRVEKEFGVSLFRERLSAIYRDIADASSKTSATVCR